MSVDTLSKATVASQPALSPVCITCGNRNTFLNNTDNAVSKLTPMEVVELKSLRSVICGRCGSRHAVILDYDEF
jgi:predicted nucleic-acid-binding Zn-ribbon protein